MNAAELPFKERIAFLETPRLQIRIDPEAEYVNAFLNESDDALKTRFGIRTDDELLVQKKKVSGGLSTYRTSVVFFHFIEKSSGQVIGSLAYHNWFPMHRRSEIGYAMQDNFKNQGYMREALPAILKYGFENIDLNRVEAFIHPQNAASQKVVERAGFVPEGHLRDHFIYNEVVGDSLVYGLLKDEWLTLTANSA